MKKKRVKRKKKISENSEASMSIFDIKMYKTLSNVFDISLVCSYVLENKRYFQPSKNRGIGKRKHLFLE